MRRIWPLCQRLEALPYAAAVKAGGALVGDTTGPVRTPLLSLDATTARELASLIELATREPARV